MYQNFTKTFVSKVTKNYRISDGMHNLARKEKSLKQKRDIEANLRKKEARQTRIEKLK